MKTTKEFIKYLQLLNQESKKFTKEESDIFIFCFLIIGFLEKAIQETLYESILNSQLPKLRYPELIDYLMKERTFMDKIKIFEFIMKRGKREDYENTREMINFCKEVNDGIRNNLFHFKIDELKYKNKSLLNFETQKELLDDFVLKVRKTLENIKKRILNQSIL